MEVMQAIKGRRSIRRYEDSPVSEEDLQTVLEAARWAPSWANSQCWRFVVVRDGATRARLAETLTVWNPALKAMGQAPVIIVVCGQLGRSGFYKGGSTTHKGDWYMFDVALASQNLTLAAYSLGLGTVHVGAFDDVKAAEVLSVPAGFAVVEMLLLGHPVGEAKAPARKELAEQVFYERWPEAPAST